MEITFYKTSSERNRLNKSLTLIKSANVVVKGDMSLISPFIELNYDADLIGCNYCYISEWNRYYFIDDFVVSTGHIINLSCNVDVLMSFKDDILNQDVIISKQENVGNKYYDMQSYRTESRSFDTIHKFNGSEFTTHPTHILICAGG